MDVRGQWLRASCPPIDVTGFYLRTSGGIVVDKDVRQPRAEHDTVQVIGAANIKLIWQFGNPRFHVGRRKHL